MEEKEIIEKLENLENELRFYQQLGAGFMVGKQKKPADEEKPAGELIELKKETESHSFQAEEWEKLIRRIRDCRFCPLFQGRTQAVPGEGNCKKRDGISPLSGGRMGKAHQTHSGLSFLSAFSGQNPGCSRRRQLPGQVDVCR